MSCCAGLESYSVMLNKSLDDENWLRTRPNQWHLVFTIAFQGGVKLTVGAATTYGI